MRPRLLTLLLVITTSSAGTADRTGARTKLAGVCHVDRTQSKAPFDLLLTVEIDGVVVTSRTNNPGWPDIHKFVVDGQRHWFPWGDTVPPEMRESTVSWLRDADGFAGTEGGAAIRWAVSPDAETLTIDTVWRDGRHSVIVHKRKKD